ncbi:hypothetical protein COCON_G00189430 [Conger conger]|uniref:DNA-(apurinic or apyrimidinic site) lyase n=1 Tax=Conger conger TaxID=82655 RepID=A0A9Q1D2T9_CONCO|nr:hypothetical protein COCON_G00189430 [Conger conger]
MEYFQSTLVKSCVKVFLCTNPEDSLEERRALREDVFPKVRDYCRRTHGLEFRVIDPYEGLDLQDVLDPRQQQVRLQLLEDCRKTSAGPFLVALVGRQYGNTGLPVQVEVSEFQQVLQTGQQMGMDTQLLEHWYERDENAIPPSFCLIDHPHHDQADGKARKIHLRDVHQEMRTIFHTIVTRCIREGSVTSEKAQKYFRSALDRELHFALENRSKEDIARCLCYVYKIARKWHQRKSITGLNVNPNLNAPSEDPLSNLRDHFLPGLVTSCQLQVYTTMSEYELHPGDSPERRRWYTEGLCQQLYTDLLNLIKCTVAKEMHRFECALSQELVQQANLCHIYSSLYRVKCKEVQHVQDYLKQKKTEYPLILFGGPCTEVKSKDGRDCSRMLKDLLLSCNRRITSGQQMHVNKALKECSLPLYVELLHRQVCNWNSSQDITEESITNGVHDNIKMFLAQLEEKHGKELVSKAMCYLTLAKSGITEAELTDILSCENEVLSQYLPVEEVLPYRLRVPEAKVENMLHALRGFLMKRNISVLSTCWTPPFATPIMEVLDTQCDMLVMILHDSSIWNIPFLSTARSKMAAQISKKRKFVSDGIFKAELNEFLTRELAEDGYSGVEVRVTPTRTEIIILATRTQNVLGEKGRRIRELTAVVQKRFGFPEGSVELYAEKVATRGLCAIAQAESLRYKLLGGLAVRRACYGVLRFIMESGAKGCEVVVSGKLRGQRAKSMKFVDGLMIHSGDPVNYYVDTAVRHVLLRQGVLGIKVKIMLPWDPSGKIGPKKPLPDHVSIVEPKEEHCIKVFAISKNTWKHLEILCTKPIKSGKDQLYVSFCKG